MPRFKHHIAGVALGIIVSASAAAAQCTYTINFAFNSSELSAENAALIDRIGRALPNGPFDVYGHTDLVGGSAYNQALSERRVASVVNRLRSAGVSASAVRQTQGFGKTQPVVDTPDPEVRNRRVLIVTPSNACDTAVAAVPIPTGLGPVGAPLGAAVALGVLAAALGSSSSSATTTGSP